MASAAVADGSSGTTRIELSIQGMTCAACAARVERKLSSLDDVRAAVNFATERASITADDRGAQGDPDSGPPGDPQGQQQLDRGEDPPGDEGLAASDRATSASHQPVESSKR